ncbi:sarcosine oxidase subunit alpha, partial [Mesorhizobium sp. M4A.F.Ca.ET.090.04.2.1]
AIERPIVFAGNDTPGVMMAAAMRSYVGRYAATPAKRVALFTNNEDGWRTVETALRTGLQVAAVIDARPDVSPAHRALASKNGFAVLNGSVTGVDGGKDGVRKISVSLTGGARAEVEADGLAVSGGWNPSVGLTSYHRGRPKWRDDIAAFVPDGAPPGMVAVGAANGAFGLSACLREGFEA